MKKTNFLGGPIYGKTNEANGKGRLCGEPR